MQDISEQLFNRRKMIKKSIWDKYNLFSIPSHSHAHVWIVKVTFLDRNNHANEWGYKWLLLHEGRFMSFRENHVSGHIFFTMSSKTLFLTVMRTTVTSMMTTLVKVAFATRWYISGPIRRKFECGFWKVSRRHLIIQFYCIIFTLGYFLTLFLGKLIRFE